MINRAEKVWNIVGTQALPGNAIACARPETWSSILPGAAIIAQDWDRVVGLEV
jgi:hypothetical protein